MPNLTAIEAVVSQLSKGPPLVIALAGGTTGIGSYIATALSTAFANRGSNLRVYIIGRNAERAALVTAESKSVPALNGVLSKR